MSEKPKPGVVAGCTGAAMSLFVTMPIWFVLLGRVILATNGTTLDWVLFCIYVPAAVLASVAVHLAKLMDE